jgi:hypothetical protein
MTMILIWGRPGRAAIRQNESLVPPLGAGQHRHADAGRGSPRPAGTRCVSDQPQGEIRKRRLATGRPDGFCSGSVCQPLPPASLLLWSPSRGVLEECAQGAHRRTHAHGLRSVWGFDLPAIWAASPGRQRPTPKLGADTHAPTKGSVQKKKGRKGQIESGDSGALPRPSEGKGNRTGKRGKPQVTSTDATVTEFGARISGCNVSQSLSAF